MDIKNNRAATIAVIAGVVMLLLGLCLGALAGGVGGYLLGRQASIRPVERIFPDSIQPEATVIPEPRVGPDSNGDTEIRGGAVIAEVITGSPAESAGIRVEDVIVQVDDMPIDINHRLGDVLGQFRPGDRVEITVWRNGQTITLNATLGANQQDASRPYLGVRYQDLALEKQTPGD